MLIPNCLGEWSITWIEWFTPSVNDCGIFISLSLTMLTGKNCVLLNSVKEITEIEAWLLLIFFICLRNKLSSIHSTAT